MVPKWLTSVIQQHRLEKWSTVASLTVLRRWKRFIIGGSHALEVLSQHSGNIGSRRLLYSPQVVQLEEWIKLQPFSIEGRRWCKEATMKKGWRSAKNWMFVTMVCLAIVGLSDVRWLQWEKLHVRIMTKLVFLWNKKESAPILNIFSWNIKDHFGVL